MIRMINDKNDLASMICYQKNVIKRPKSNSFEIPTLQ